MQADDAHLALFLPQRQRLLVLAYRMLGSRSDAEDVVQDAWLRWRDCRLADIQQPQAWLLRSVARLCLDWLKSARHRREQYTGVWLPEPLPDSEDAWQHDPAWLCERAVDVSYAGMVALERLSAAERAVFVLRELFDMDYAELASLLSRSEAACRQLLRRARRALAEAADSPRALSSATQPLLLALLRAVQSGDSDVLAAMLAADVRYLADGGGKVRALVRPLQGRRPVARLLCGLYRRWGQPGLYWQALALNGGPGMVLCHPEQGVLLSLILACDINGEVAVCYVVANPDKLLAMQSALASPVGTAAVRQVGAERDAAGA